MSDVKISDLPAAGAITGAELVPIVQGGVTSQSTVDGIKNGAVKVYRALLTQSGTNAPVATVLENTLGGDPVWSYIDVGQYALTLTGVFVETKTIMFINQDNAQVIRWLGNNSQPDSLLLFVVTAFNRNPQNNGLWESSIEILVYP